MKLPFKPIAILVIISLLGIFIYQAYWITGLYKTMKHELEQSIVEAMRMSDYNEMMLRVKAMQKENKAHGSVEVSAGYNSESGKSFVRSSTTVNQTDSAGSLSLLKDGIPMKYDSVSVSYPNDSTRDILFTRGQEGTNISVWAEKDSVKEVLEDTVINEDEPQASLRAEGGIDMMLRDQSSMVELATFIQRGMHPGLDIFIEPDIAVYDSLLNAYLQERGLKLPYRLERLHSGADPDSTLVYTDTLAIVGTPGYMPSEKAKQYNYAFDIHSNQSYRLTIEPIYKIVLRQMSGILTTSFVILIILGFSFWFLIRTILRQKTLEEMKSDFTNNITHELKTPIAVAYAANDALLNFNLAEDKQQRDKYLGICQEQLQRLSGLVEQILSMSMERRKTFRLHPETLSLHDLFPTLIEQHKLKAGKPVEINLDIAPEDLTIIADRTHFSNILSNLVDGAEDYATDKSLQERIHLGAEYFKEQLEPLDAIRSSTIVETDNKELKKQLKTASEELDDLLLLKVDLLEFVISKGFHVGEYLKQKAVLSIDDTASTKGKGEKRSGNSTERRKRKGGTEESGNTPARKKTAAVEVPSDILHPELYRRLVAWRNAEASQLGLPVYTVIQQKAILGITNLLPEDKSALLRIPYFGKKGVEKYGDELLEMVRVYKKESGIAETLFSD